MNIGILALQGDIREHADMLKTCKANPIEVRRREDFQNLDGLIIPGGESTTIMKLMEAFSIDK